MQHDFKDDDEDDIFGEPEGTCRERWCAKCGKSMGRMSDWEWDECDHTCDDHILEGEGDEDQT